MRRTLAVDVTTAIVRLMRFAHHLEHSVIAPPLILTHLAVHAVGRASFQVPVVNPKYRKVQRSRALCIWTAFSPPSMPPLADVSNVPVRKARPLLKKCIDPRRSAAVMSAKRTDET